MSYMSLYVTLWYYAYNREQVDADDLDGWPLFVK